MNTKIKEFYKRIKISYYPTLEKFTNAGNNEIVNDLKNKYNLIKKEYNINGLKRTKFNDENNLSWFDCGCCGIDFKSTINKQKHFDQDAGYGFCSECQLKYK